MDDGYALLTREHKRRIVSERLLAHESEHYDTRLDVRQLQSKDLAVPQREEQLAIKLAKLSALESMTSGANSSDSPTTTRTVERRRSRLMPRLPAGTAEFVIQSSSASPSP
jgi:hypothetical protein